MSRALLTLAVPRAKLGYRSDLHRPGCWEARHEESPVPARAPGWLEVLTSVRYPACLRLPCLQGRVAWSLQHLVAGESARGPRLRYGWAVLVYDRVYRVLHRLGTPASVVGLAAYLEVRRCYRMVQLSGGMTVRRGDRIGVLHLNNDFVVALHQGGLPPPIAVGLEFRRHLVTALYDLARLASPEGRLNDVTAFSVTTIFFHQGFRRLGFEAEACAPGWPRVVAAYQRALLASLHPAGPARVRGSRYRRALRLWISRETLLARYGAVATLRNESEHSTSR